MARLPLRWLPLAAGVLLPLLAPGCGSAKVYPVEGDVVFPDGTPLRGGLVIFEPKAAEGEVSLTGSRGEIDQNGHFRMTTFKRGDGALAGVNRVLIAPPSSGKDPERERIPEVIDPKYRKFETSGLEFTVTSDRKKNYLKIVVEPPPRR
jgi:hypothetical protein